MCQAVGASLLLRSDISLGVGMRVRVRVCVSVHVREARFDHEKISWYTLMSLESPVPFSHNTEIVQVTVEEVLSFTER